MEFFSGTRHELAKRHPIGYSVQVIDLAEIVSRKFPVAGNASREELPPRPRPKKQVAEIRAILFADVLNFSKLTEEQVPLFVQHFLGEVGQLTALSSYAPVIKNTWGDGLYFVFRDVHDAGRFALDLCERTAEINWAEKGLPGDLKLRIALHAGPVHFCSDPVTQLPTYTGSHVTRAARIEPVTPPGQVYASEAFAALAASERVSEFRCNFVGTIALAKRSGEMRLYHVRRC